MILVTTEDLPVPDTAFRKSTTFPPLFLVRRNFFALLPKAPSIRVNIPINITIPGRAILKGFLVERIKQEKHNKKGRKRIEHREKLRIAEEQKRTLADKLPKKLGCVSKINL